MPVFSYTARDRTGQTVADRIESASREQAMLGLRQNGLLVLQIDEVKSNRFTEKNYSLNPLDYRSLRALDIEMAFHQIAVMLRSGISLLDALEITRKFSRIGVRKVWQGIIEHIEQGGTLAGSLGEHKLFPDLTIHLVKVGEQTGMLHIVMDQAAEEMKASRLLRKQIMTSLRYPLFALLMAIGVAAFMLTSIIPEIKKLLKIMGRPMPPVTKALIDSSDWIMLHGAGIGIGFGVFLVTFVLLYNWPPSRWWMDRLALKIPVFGRVFRLASTVLFCRAMNLLLRSGVLITDALATMVQLHGNKYVASQVDESRERIMQGATLAEMLEQRPVFEPLMVQMIRVGENSGALDDILQEMMIYHDALLQQAIAKLTGLIAPMMTILVGGIIGFVYAAFLVAMFSAAGGSPS